ncbi:DNA binding transcription coactivator transcription factor [Lobosporangium transversale]|uniref:Homeodomain-like protein n=1 Tax=Lobosporangium transversale TaxID=64571 RepID=A0A1Y2GBK2_9FUNG|nr:hypothetical protein BCR41DRAFT_374087 [Lobosporangium transversale]KAF9898336.1 DNA binding transcription coactivator transcription factor [Lobosporangium transversale]ORZ06366.1 hypothetical protein BCR41DRAFT_374087 [Lobosporangium transversale]|eukprot:XP_021877529.1 hypothetical protein BCR41DRAFT_374087 [Lobosporangium transversale]
MSARTIHPRSFILNAQPHYNVFLRSFLQRCSLLVPPHRSSLSFALSSAPEPIYDTPLFQPSSPSSLSYSTHSTSSSVRLRIHSSGPKRNDSDWTPEHDSILLSLRAQGKTWTQIGEALGRSRQACNRRFDSVLNPESGEAFWKSQPHKNHLLKEYVRQRQSWKTIAHHLGTKASACERQWRILARQSQAQGQNQGHSMDHEDGRDDMEHLGPSRVNALSSLDRVSITSVNRIRWTAAQVQRLKHAVAEYGLNNWETIANSVFDGQFTPTYLRRQYTKLEQRRKVWREQQDKELSSAVMNLYKSLFPTLPTPSSSESVSPKIMDDVLSQNQWDMVAKSISGEHSASECRAHWLRMQLWALSRQLRGRKNVSVDAIDHDGDGNNHNIHQQNAPASSSESCIASASQDERGLWTLQQSQRLESIIKSMKESASISDTSNTMFTIDWDKVSALMDHKFTKQQCKSRWNRMLRQVQGSTTSGRWDEEEIENLVVGVYNLGPQWAEIRRNWVHGRAPTFIQGKWVSIRNKVYNEMVVQRWTWMQASIEIYGQHIGETLGKVAERWPSLCEMPTRHQKHKPK